jgi:hypothetical protein
MAGLGAAGAFEAAVAAPVVSSAPPTIVAPRSLDIVI